MSGQALDLRRSARIVRQHRALVGVIAVLGLLIGAGYALFNPPVKTSTALIVLPVSSHEVATQVVVAQSQPVLSAALPGIHPSTTVTALQNHLQIKSLTGNLISVTATGSSPAQAESSANAVARSFIAYLVSGNSAVGHVRANLVAPASNATGSSLLVRLVMLAVVGAIIGALAGAVAALALARGDRRLRERDAIADAIGVPVVASAAVGHPSDPGGWTKLLAEYEPGVINAWSLRRALNQLGLVDLDLNTPLEEDRPSVAVISLSSDRKALAVGPQLAVFAASLGVSTELLVGTQADENETASLRSACSALSAQPPIHDGRLRVTANDAPPGGEDRDTLRVLVSVVDEHAPKVDETARAAVTVLAISPGTATAEQLARVAVSAAVDGRKLAGIIVADPDSADRTSGRLPQPGRPAGRRPPTRVYGTTTETRR
jgi:capsular polysaccharide biosynthesis protein